MAMAVYPLHVKYGVKKFISATYQAASGAGKEGMEELSKQMSAYPEEHKYEDNGKPNKEFVHKLCGNIIPHIDKFQENGYTKEEMKVVWETKKIFGIKDDSLRVSCTAVRIPTLRAHAKAVTLELEKPFESIDEVRNVLSKDGGKMLEVVDETAANKYPMPMNATGKY